LNASSEDTCPAAPEPKVDYPELTIDLVDILKGAVE
jgi:hypothetical protein